ncbi:hypothetical protein Ahy_A07g031216 isoform D [Arachis hypogaea]|uniref:Uncharacterized protein n=1 Tax=Arachis hypogaea TaxID=3818 RepID=A0A445C383_ARAHY|nr:hypothetical protein Ahy_A07g031216 isoform D [Arachis hypogaea]
MLYKQPENNEGTQRIISHNAEKKYSNIPLLTKAFISWNKRSKWKGSFWSFLQGNQEPMTRTDSLVQRQAKDCTSLLSSFTKYKYLGFRLSSRDRDSTCGFSRSLSLEVIHHLCCSGEAEDVSSPSSLCYLWVLPTLWLETCIEKKRWSDGNDLPYPGTWYSQACQESNMRLQIVLHRIPQNLRLPHKDSSNISMFDTDTH